METKRNATSDQQRNSDSGVANPWLQCLLHEDSPFGNVCEKEKQGGNFEGNAETYFGKGPAAEGGVKAALECEALVLRALVPSRCVLPLSLYSCGVFVNAQFAINARTWRCSHSPSNFSAPECRLRCMIATGSASVSLFLCTSHGNSSSQPRK